MSGAEGMPDHTVPLCGRCYDEVDKTFPANCAEKPETLKGQPIGQYHCPDCGAMVMAGYPHPEMCKRCIDRKHPGFDNFQAPSPSGICTYCGGPRSQCDPHTCREH